MPALKIFATSVALYVFANSIVSSAEKEFPQLAEIFKGARGASLLAGFASLLVVIWTL